MPDLRLVEEPEYRDPPEPTPARVPGSEVSRDDRGWEQQDERWGEE